MSSRIYVGDIGTELSINCYSDIAAATVSDLIVQKPNKEVVRWTGSVTNTSYVSYTLQAGDVSLKGIYKAQAYIEIDGWSGLGKTFTFTVYAPFT